MNATDRPSDGGRGRGAFVAAVVATAAAAVAAGVALNEHHLQAHDIPADAAGNARQGSAAPESDPSLPAASDVIDRAPAETAESAPTF